MEQTRKYKLKYYNMAKKIVQNRMIFFFHLSVYLVVNIMFLTINLVSNGKPGWAVLPAVFWATFIVGHFCHSFLFNDVTSKNPMQVERFEKRSFFYVHLIVYALNSLAFICCNLVYGGGVWWAVYPIAGWGIGIFYHYFFMYIFRGWKIKKWKQYQTVKLMKKYFSIDPFEENNQTNIKKD